eukprot:gene10124-7088_t
MLIVIIIIIIIIIIVITILFMWKLILLFNHNKVFLFLYYQLTEIETVLEIIIIIKTNNISLVSLQYCTCYPQPYNNDKLLLKIITVIQATPPAVGSSFSQVLKQILVFVALEWYVACLLYIRISPVMIRITKVYNHIYILLFYSLLLLLLLLSLLFYYLEYYFIIDIIIIIIIIVLLIIVGPFCGTEEKLKMIISLVTISSASALFLVYAFVTNRSLACEIDTLYKIIRIPKKTRFMMTQKADLKPEQKRKFGFKETREERNEREDQEKKDRWKRRLEKENQKKLLLELDSLNRAAFLSPHQRERKCLVERMIRDLAAENKSTVKSGNQQGNNPVLESGNQAEDEEESIFEKFSEARTDIFRPRILRRKETFSRSPENVAKDAEKKLLDLAKSIREEDLDDFFDTLETDIVDYGMPKLMPFFERIQSSMVHSKPFNKYNFCRSWIMERLDDFSFPLEFIGKRSSHYTVLLYGSAVAGTSLEDGDADFSLVFYSTEKQNHYEILDMTRDHQETALSKVFQHINRGIDRPMNTQRIFRARVPVVQFSSLNDDFSNCKFDLCLSSNGVRNSLLIREYMKSDPVLHCGCLLAKQWGRSSNILNSRRGWISPYALSILYIYYWKTVKGKQFIPESSVNDKLNEIIHMCHEGRYSQSEDMNSPVPIQAVNQNTVANDLSEFFSFYSKEFDFDSAVVDIRENSQISLKDDWTKSFEGTPSCERWNMLGHENLFIRDPFESHNLGRSVDFLKSEQIREAFRVATRKDNPLYFISTTHSFVMIKCFPSPFPVLEIWCVSTSTNHHHNKNILTKARLRLLVLFRSILFVPPF